MNTLEHPTTDAEDPHTLEYLHRQARRQAVQELMLALVQYADALRWADEERPPDRRRAVSCEQIGRRIVADVAMIVYPLLEAAEAIR
jgi:hypothetical protein